MGEIHPDLPPVWPRHGKDRLTVGLGAPRFGQGVRVDPQHLVMTDGGQDKLAPCQRPTFQMGHLVDRHFLLPAPIVWEHPDRFRSVRPQVQRGQPVLAKQAGDIGAAIGGDQRVIGVFAHVADLGDLGRSRCEIGDPGLARVPHGKDEPPPRRVDKANGLAAGRDVGDHLKRVGIKHPHAARFIVRNGDQFPVIRDCAANGIPGLHDTVRDGPRDDIDLCQSAVAAKDIGKAFIGRIDQRGVGQIAQALDPRQRGPFGLVDQKDRAGGPFNHQPQVSGRCGFGLRGGHQQGGGKGEGKMLHGASGSSR